MSRADRLFSVDPAGSFRSTDAQGARTGGLWKFDGLQPTLTDGLGNKYWFIDTTAANVAVTLPSALEMVGVIFTVKRTTAGANTLVVTPVAGNIDGAASHSIGTQYAAYSYTSDGSNYWIV
ncbi:MAG: hypothetical protein ABIO88_04635 [Burkholderiaceae bacterium]